MSNAAAPQVAPVLRAKSLSPAFVRTPCPARAALATISCVPCEARLSERCPCCGGEGHSSLETASLESLVSAWQAGEVSDAELTYYVVELTLADADPTCRAAWREVDAELRACIELECDVAYLSANPV